MDSDDRSPPPELPSSPRDPRAEALPPAEVHLACALVMASFALGLLTLLPGMRPPEPAADAMPVLTLLLLLLVFGGLTVWFTLRTWQGRVWARWALLGYLALGWLMAVATLGDDFAEAPLATLINAACIVMEIAACLLLFTGAGARWFAARAARAGRGA